MNPALDVAPRRELIRFRVTALVPAALFGVVLVSFPIAPGAIWAEYVGILFHLSIPLLAARLDGPGWARPAAYAWVALDVLAGTLYINEIPHDQAWPVRLAAHIFAGIWMATSSLYVRAVAVRVVGVAAGVWLTGYTLLENVLPQGALGPASILATSWFVLLAVLHKPVPAASGRSH
ncbi:hypothetical protein Val02_74620 [Virgisporangium aliadipatigenens]|uniref:Uncharacterized protein n=1 Tax=Virgisporangium aliadipatigenens TaxID=741659 RepID=A0A8J4DUN7_9ACTN|nr:hypothetical protein [Virgisporangium aliadipatigenens]GIJ50576.1 hypothetical protein Val02_74620 [Virgisporangium aliadipatigenens]